ncbi:hypothetical protein CHINAEXTREME_09605 [Halobiforma lacisalsi AJ5]|uniref:DUF5658 domain-containing protein n=1 Tax=Natronobacterium lacisalsi AJ5 TaxID=358396 RepID=M0L4U5_NATLA|nr:hypothetical protein [Halobiforma lacisalsi]APW98020.1 hypothetical protein CHINAEXTREME_09605 [Halobiforma lacisalsi AJ5]EMA28576.1 hypothetical protein C445_18166 [Halobiforma lacisalsi AJ5]
MATAPATVTAPATAAILWLLAILLYGLGDLVTTAAGLRAGLKEGQPFVRRLLGESPTAWRLGLFGLYKAVLLGGFYLAYLALEGLEVRFRFAIPAGIAAIGSYAVATNVRTMLTAR